MRHDQAAVPFDEYPSYKGGHTCVYGRYVWEFAPSHPLRNRWGWVAQHRLVAEDLIGRPLIQSADPKIQEVVHHKDENPKNNDPENLAVMTMSAHRAHHTRKRSREYYAAKRPSRKEVAAILDQTKSIKATAAHFGMHHQSIRNHYPDLVAPYKRSSPTSARSPTNHELETIRRFAADDQKSIDDCRRALRVAERTVLAICQNFGIEWVPKTKRGQLRRHYRGKPTRRWLEAHGSTTESEKVRTEA